MSVKNIKLIALRLKKLSWFQRRWVLKKLPREISVQVRMAYRELQGIQGINNLSFDELVALVDEHANRQGVSPSIKCKSKEISGLSLSGCSERVLREELAVMSPVTIAMLLRGIEEDCVTNIIGAWSSEKKGVIENLADSLATHKVPKKLLCSVVYQLQECAKFSPVMEESN